MNGKTQEIKKKGKVVGIRKEEGEGGVEQSVWDRRGNWKQFGDAWVNLDVWPRAVVFNHVQTGEMVEQKLSGLMVPEAREEKPSHAKLFYGENWVDLMNEDAAAYYDWWMEEMGVKK